KYINSKSLQTVRDSQNSYRIANLSVFDDTTSIQTIQILYKVNREKEMLKYLLVIIEFGSIISVFLSIIAGTYLANKALIPIKSAWDKQRQFVADASHELRTPLSVSKLNLEHLFRRPHHTIEQESENVNQVIQEINYMTKMSESLLTLARSDSNQTEILMESLQLDQILQQIVKSFKELATLKNIKVMAEISSIPMMGDKERIKQLFIIIMDNALKYTKENGTITLKASVKNSHAMIEISDTGIGISSEDLPHIFDRFYRGDKSRNRRIEGTGLGLSIANWIVQSHRGKINVKSKVGVGTTVLVSFPLKIK
ncbi:MAG TPA: HAMP domain-containing sensor histidine kinase, partial [Bacillales bacterium]|nr:HAMP domain-containing sensor histidine kinase [Bacillales bacterium]